MANNITTALLDIIDDGMAGDNTPSTFNPNWLVPKVTTGAVDGGKAGDKPCTVKPLITIVSMRTVL